MKRYKILEKLSTGAIGSVLKVEDLSHKKIYALKSITAASQEKLEALTQEFQILRSLKHPHLLEVYELENSIEGIEIKEDSFQTFIKEEFIDGGELYQAHQNFDENRIKKHLEEILNTLDYLHHEKLLHGDIKGENILINQNDEVKICDFSLSQKIKKNSDAYLSGTLPYLAPESFQGKYSVQTDLYALGVTLYKLCTKKFPYPIGKDNWRLAASYFRKGFLPPSKLNPTLSKKLDYIIIKLLQKEPKKRYASAKEVLFDLKYDDKKLRSSQRELYPYVSELIGREKEWKELCNFKENEKNHLVISGSIGVGKTRLIEEFKTDIQVSQNIFWDPYRIDDLLSYLPPEITESYYKKLQEKNKLSPSLNQTQENKDIEFEAWQSLLHSIEKLYKQKKIFIKVNFEHTLWDIIKKRSSHQIKLIEEKRFYEEKSPQSSHIKLKNLDEKNARSYLKSLIKEDRLDEKELQSLIAKGKGNPKILRLLLENDAHSDLDNILESLYSELNTQEKEIIHLVAFSNFDLSFKEIQSILQIKEEQVQATLFQLKNKEILFENEKNKIQISQSGLKKIALQQIKNRKDTIQKWNKALIQILKSNTESENNEEDLLVHQILSDQLEPIKDFFFKSIKKLKNESSYQSCLKLLYLFLEKNQDPETEKVLWSEIAEIDELLAHDEKSLESYKKAGNTIKVALNLQRQAKLLEAFDLYESYLKKEKIEDDKKLQILSLQAMIQIYLGDLEKAKDLCENAKKYLNEELSSAASYYNSLALYYKSTNQIEKSIELYEKSYQLVQREPKKRNLASIANNLAMAYQSKNQFKKAKNYYQNALEDSRYLSDQHLQISILINSASLAHSESDYSKALHYFQRALDLSESYGSPYEKMILSLNLSNTYLRLGLQKEAYSYLKEAKEIIEKQSYQQCLNQVYILETEINLNFKNWNDDSIKKFKEEFKKKNDNRSLAYIIFFEITNFYEEDPEKALKLFEELKQIESQLKIEEIKILKDLSQIKIKLFNDSDNTLEEKFSSLEKYYQVKNMNEELWELYYLKFHYYINKSQNKKAQEAQRKAEEILKSIFQKLPSKFREDFYQTRLRKAFKSENTQPLLEDNTMQSQERLKRLIDINKKLTSQKELSNLIQYIMDSALDLTQAKRGFIVLKKEGLSDEDLKNPYNIVSSRNLEENQINDNEMDFSRSLISQVIESGESFLSDEATNDADLLDYDSIHKLKLKSVLVCPLKNKGSIIGVIYIDNRFTSSAFSNEDLELLSALSDQASLAIETTNLIEELLESKFKVENLNEKLSEELKDKTKEMDSIKRLLKESKKDLALKYDYSNIVGDSPRMVEVFRILDQVSDTDIPILIRGESGTGKELIAKACHYNSSRKDHTFVSENCAAIPSNLLESELFGHYKGSFTGATHDKAGLFEFANRGSLFLDEIGDMPIELQTKLLRVLQEKEIRPLGSQRWIPIDVRIISATNKDLGQLISEGKFREDLYYRLNGIELNLPCLKDRIEDLPLLIEYFIRTFSKKYKKPKINLSTEAFNLLMEYKWPGNIRELESCLRTAFLFANDEIQIRHFTFKKELFVKDKSFIFKAEPETISKRLSEISSEKDRIICALEAHGFNKVKTAKALGVSRKTLYNKIDFYKIDTQIQIRH